VNEAVGRYQLVKQLHLTTSDLVAFLASHFFELSDSVRKSLDYDDFVQLLGHPKIQLKSEDQLYEALFSRFGGDPEFSGLMEFVDFDFLSPECVAKFVAETQELPELSLWLNRSVWTVICRRLVLPVSPDSCARHHTLHVNPMTQTQIPYTGSTPLDGILAFLTKRHSCNLHDKGTVTVTGAPCKSDSPQISIYTAPQKGGGYLGMTPDAQGCWFCFDFKDRRVTPTHYTMQGCCANAAPSAWTIDGSTDGETWETLHSVDGCSRVSEANVCVNFAVSVSKTCRFVRFRQQASLSASPELHMKSFELFGSLEE
jgi:hypothetical protein